MKISHTLIIVFVISFVFQSSFAEARKSNKRICSDPQALNYNPTRFGRHANKMCKYEHSSDNSSFNFSNSAVNKSLFHTGSSDNLNQCPFQQYMRKGDRDGQIGREKQQSGITNLITQVAYLQFHLKALEFNPGPIDGIFGPLTDAAVRRYQESHFSEVLTPWELKSSTGRFYQSSERWMNEILNCNDSVTLDNGVYLD